jgi:hypothetical protein
VPDTIPHEPDTAFLRKRLFRFFESHKNKDVFDTTDDTYAKYWGTSSWFVDAGHLFNKNQVHAMILYSDELTTKMFIYLKKNKHWIKIFENTNIGNFRWEPELKDWNGDGTKDIYFSEHKSWSDAVSLWLVEKSGEKIHYIKEF